MSNFLIGLIECSVTMSIISLIYLVVLPRLSKRYSARGLYTIGLIIMTGWLMTFSFPTSLSIQTKPAIIQSFSTALIRLGDTNTINHNTNNSMTEISFSKLFLSIWMLGVIISVLYHIYRHQKFRQLVKRWSKDITNPNLLQNFCSLKQQLNITKNIKLKLCPYLSTPMLIGFFKSTILLPNHDLDNNKLTLILHHELLHLKKYDLWIKLLVLVTTILHWFNPIVYLFAKHIALQSELACDQDLILDANPRTRMQYCQIILEHHKSKAYPETVMTTNFYGGKNSMKKRILSIMDSTKKKSAFLLLCISLIGILSIRTAFSNSSLNSSQNPTIIPVIIRHLHQDMSSFSGNTYTANLIYNQGTDDWQKAYITANYTLSETTNVLAIVRDCSVVIAGENDQYNPFIITKRDIDIAKDAISVSIAGYHNNENNKIQEHEWNFVIKLIPNINSVTNILK